MEKEEQNTTDHKKFHAEWEKEQLELKKQLIFENDFDWSLNDNTLKLIGGVDISFIKGNDTDACAALVVLAYPSLKVVYEKCEMIQLTLPYIPSFLAFREVPFLLKLVNELKNNPDLYPQVLFTDGNGVLHPRGFGIASHLGVLLGLPTIGIGKTLFHVDGITKDKTRALFAERCVQGGKEFVNLVGDSGAVWGAAFRSTKDATNPVYISTGHKIDLPTAIQLSSLTCQFRVPEAVRQADLRSRDFLRKYEKEMDEKKNGTAEKSVTEGTEPADEGNGGNGGKKKGKNKRKKKNSNGAANNGISNAAADNGS